MSEGSRDRTGAGDADATGAAQRLEDLLAEHREPDAGPPDTAATDATPFDPFAPLPAAGDATPGTAGAAGPAGASSQLQAEEGETGDGLPDTPLFALLRIIEGELDIERIDRIWVFPPRRHQAGETAVVVVGAFSDDRDDNRRRVYAAHYTLHEDASEPRLAMDEYGTAPTERVGRLVEEVVERIKDEPASAPRSHTIGGSRDRWSAVLHELAGAWLEEVQKNPRLRR